MVDSEAPTSACPACAAVLLVDTYELDGQRCPYCKSGKFAIDPEHYAIS